MAARSEQRNAAAECAARRPERRRRLRTFRRQKTLDSLGVSTSVCLSGPEPAELEYLSERASSRGFLVDGPRGGDPTDLLAHQTDVADHLKLTLELLGDGPRASSHLVGNWWVMNG